MGIYEKIGDFNNHPLYFLSQHGYKNYLYFKMDGKKYNRSVYLTVGWPKCDPWAISG